MHPSTLSEEPQELGAPPIDQPLPSFPPFTPASPEREMEPDDPSIEEMEVVDIPFSDDPEDAFAVEPSSHSVDDATPSSGGEASAVFLKQNGQIYMVSDWDTLKRWIAESRVERHDLVSEGGVRWEPVGNRAELMVAFGGSPPPSVAPFPFGGETPFGASDGRGGLGWHDDDTEGVPTGLPPLPTDEIPAANARGFDALDARLRKMTPTPPPVARRAPPPQKPVFMTPIPQPRIEPPNVARMDPADITTLNPEVETPADQDLTELDEPELLGEPEEEILPPALPDTVPPAPARQVTAGAVPDEESRPTQPGAFPRGAMKPKAFRMADEDTLEMEVPIDEIADFEDLEQPSVLQPMSPEDTDPDLFVPRRRGPLQLLALWVLLGAVFFIAMAIGYILIRSPVQGQRPPPPLPIASKPLPTPTVPAPVGPAPGTEPTLTAPEPTVPEPAVPDPEPAAPDPEPASPDPEPTAPAPAPVAPAPTPAPPRPTRPTPVRPAPATVRVSALIDQGWAQVEGNPRGALATFRKALKQSPQNGDANYGVGYALVRSGDANAARPYLCKARSKGSVDTRREAEGILQQNGLACP